MTSSCLNLASDSLLRIDRLAFVSAISARLLVTSRRAILLLCAFWIRVAASSCSRACASAAFILLLSASKIVSRRLRLPFNSRLANFFLQAVWILITHSSFFFCANRSSVCLNSAFVGKPRSLRTRSDGDVPLVPERAVLDVPVLDVVVLEVLVVVLDVVASLSLSDSVAESEDVLLRRDVDVEGADRDDEGAVREGAAPEGAVREGAVREGVVEAPAREGAEVEAPAREGVVREREALDGAGENLDGATDSSEPERSVRSVRSVRTLRLESLDWRFGGIAAGQEPTPWPLPPRSWTLPLCPVCA
mmetsp:Transcript_28380/g.64215  ORF Transcript_28380/g.64215 Transcript_28380/m.64215 type:complete len:305 (+) Transcript_28380:644-1558(+)